MLDPVQLASFQGIGAKHPIVKHVTLIASNKSPNPRRQVFVEGVWALQKILGANLAIDILFVCPELINNPTTERLIASAVPNADRTYSVSGSTMEKLAEKGDNSGVGCLVSLHTTTLEQLGQKLRKSSIVVIADAVEIPGNIGTILRTTDAVAGDALVLCNKRARITHPKVVRGSQGACFFVPMVEATVEETELWLAKHNYQVIFADTRGAMRFDEFTPGGRVAIIMGSERYGISKQWTQDKAQAVSIPMFGTNDSLNVAVATSILLYDIKLKMESKASIRNAE